MGDFGNGVAQFSEHFPGSLSSIAFDWSFNGFFPSCTYLGDSIDSFAQRQLRVRLNSVRAYVFRFALVVSTGRRNTLS
jgi:hypothetical protein